MSKGKTLRLLTVGLVLILSASVKKKLTLLFFALLLILLPSVLNSEGLHFGIISAINNKVKELKEQKEIDELPQVTNIVDSTTMYGKIITGYQGWFSCIGDGSQFIDTWGHWFHWDATPDTITLKVDMWPDIRELDEDELFTTNMKMSDGSPAMLFSSYKEKTVLRHFKWMQEYGIDGVFLQRFVSGLYDKTTPSFDFTRQVMQNVRVGCESYGRVFAIEYDITDADPNLIVNIIKQDWISLVDEIKITQSERYLKHKGKPVVVLWGFGFNDGHHDFTSSQAMELIDWFKTTAEEKYQATLVGGVPSRWRTCRDDSFPDPENGIKWSAVYRSYDVILPWTVGRYSNINEANLWKEHMTKPDLIDAKSHEIDYMPVVFPGFSFHNMHRNFHGTPVPPLNEIKREGGTFYWKQIYNAISAFKEIACEYAMVKVAMFDEVDEGTAIFKLAPTINDVPLGVDFVTLDIDGDNLPGDWYLTLTGEGAKMLRGEIPLNGELP